MTRWSLRLLATLVILCHTPLNLAATPRDTLVMAWIFDDIITLDPAEIFEFSGAEVGANSYDRLMGYNPFDVSELFGVVAEDWRIGADGKTYTFIIRDGIRFASGNPLTADDVAFSLQRVVKLNKSPAFILTQFGFDPDNVDQTIRALDPRTVELVTDRAYAPTFLLYCLTAGISAVVDKAQVLAHERDGDLGHGWLRTHYAGSGPFTISRWIPNEVVILERNADYWGEKAQVERVIIRHIIEPGTQRLLLEKGDVDIARNLNPDQLKALANNPDIRVRQGVKGALHYFSLNQQHPILAKPAVRQAFKYLVDYQGIADNLLQGQVAVHQAFLPRGFLGALEENPFSLDIPKAKALLAEAGHSDGFAVTMDTANKYPIMDIAQAIQATAAQAGITIDILPGDDKQTLTKYRARNHEIYIGRWGPDYQDPHTNASTFASNPDNSSDAKTKPLAWRNAWEIPEMTAKTQAAVVERDGQRRAELYGELQREHQRSSPFVLLFQATEFIAERSDVSGFVIGPSFDDNRYRAIVKR